MLQTGRIARLVPFVSALFILSGCPSGGDSSKSDSPVISVTSLGNVDRIETIDVSIQLVGTAKGAAEVSWKNDRGGNGDASGAENWSTGPIVLQLGRNRITITAADEAGKTTSKEVRIDREIGPFSVPEDDSEPVVMYSYSSDLSDAAPLEGAHVDEGVVHLFVERATDWESRGLVRMDFDCCDGGGSIESAFSSPWQVATGVSSPQPGLDRELEVIAHLARAVDRRSFRFFTTAEDREENQAPTIEGAPALGATVGLEYSYRPIAIDPNGDTMGFTIQNKPRWATFDPVTGHLKGYPTSSDVGTYSDIRISVSDGRTTTRQAAFSIQVDAFTDNAVTLTWEAPTERENGQPLTNLAGFEIYYGPLSGNLGNTARIPNPGIYRHTIENLQTGDWKFVIVAYDRNGNYSDPSNAVSTSIP